VFKNTILYAACENEKTKKKNLLNFIPYNFFFQFYWRTSCAPHIYAFNLTSSDYNIATAERKIASGSPFSPAATRKVQTEIDDTIPALTEQTVFAERITLYLYTRTRPFENQEPCVFMRVRRRHTLYYNVYVLWSVRR